MENDKAEKRPGKVNTESYYFYFGFLSKNQLALKLKVIYNRWNRNIKQFDGKFGSGFLELCYLGKLCDWIWWVDGWSDLRELSIRREKRNLSPPNLRHSVTLGRDDLRLATDNSWSSHHVNAISMMYYQSRINHKPHHSGPDCHLDTHHTIYSQYCYGRMFSYSYQINSCQKDCRLIQECFCFMEHK